MTEASLSDVDFARAEYARYGVADATLRRMCARQAEIFAPARDQAAAIVAARLISLIERRRAGSLVRVGDGEGNALGLTRPIKHPVQMSSFMAKFVSQNGSAIAENEALALCGEIRDSLLSADMLGFRFHEPLSTTTENGRIEDNLDGGLQGAALGMTYALGFLHEQLDCCALTGKVLTNAWVHLALIPRLDDILSAAQAVVIIAGRVELEQAFRDRLGSRLQAFVPVPVQGFSPPTDAQSHYRAAFPKVLDFLRQDLSGVLVLVGAGLLGKIYCHVARANGAVAADLGSAFDLLAGRVTRPIHTLFDTEALRWL